MAKALIYNNTSRRFFSVDVGESLNDWDPGVYSLDKMYDDVRFFSPPEDKGPINANLPKWEKIKSNTSTEYAYGLTCDETLFTLTVQTKTVRKATGGTPVKNETWDLIDAVLAHSRRILLLGPPGTGKTYAATRRGGAEKVYTITLTPETPMAELRGHFVPKGGEMVWMDGPAIRAWRENARLVVNEIDHAGPDCQSLLFAVLDDPEFAEFTLPTGETVKPGPGFSVVATMNGEVEDLPPALRDRFPVTITVEQVNPEALAALPQDLQYVAQNTALHSDEDRRLSIRMWAEFANLRKQMVDKYGNPKGLELAAQAVFGERADEALNALELAKDL